MDDYVGSEMTPAFAISQAPNEKVRALLQSVMGASARPANLTPAEADDLRAFEIQLANENIESRRVAMNGGVAGIVQKNRVTESLLANNIHAQGNQ